MTYLPTEYFDIPVDVLQHLEESEMNCPITEISNEMKVVYLAIDKKLYAWDYSA